MLGLSSGAVVISLTLDGIQMSTVTIRFSVDRSTSRSPHR